MPVEPDLGTWLAVVVAAALAGMDSDAGPQAMVSRPLVTATAGGWLLGDPAVGFLAGAMLELLFLRHVPFGGARCPDAGPAGVVAGAAGAASPTGLAPLLAAVAAGWAVAWIGEVTVRASRRLAGRALADVDALAARPGRLERRHLLLTGFEAIRGGALAAALLIPAAAAVRLVGEADATHLPAALSAAALGAAAGAAARVYASSRLVAALTVTGVLAGAAAGWGLL